MSKHDIIVIIFKCCVSKIYLILLITNLQRTCDKRYQIDKYIKVLYLESVLFLR